MICGVEEKSMEQYSKKVMEYFTRPKNMGVIKDADGVGTVGNPRCGDVMKVYIKVGKRLLKISNFQSFDKLRTGFPISNKISNFKSQKSEKTEEYIEDIKVQTLGCGAAIATSSIATEMVMGKSLEEALKVSNKQVADALGGLPKVKYHCSVLAEEGIKKAIEDYKKRKVLN